MVRKTREDAEKTKSDLLDAAQRLFISQGVSRTSLNEIAKSAGLTRGAVYWHFDNKDAIIIALYERGAGVVSDEMLVALENIDINDAVGQFRSALLHIVQRIVTDPNVGQAMHVIMHCTEITDTQTPLRDFLNTQRKHIYQMFYKALEQLKTANAIKSDLAIEVITGGLMSYLYGLVEHHLEADGFLNLERDYIELVDIYLNGFLDFDNARA